jgi:uncharacterized SAM-binding protein YcdF (DUF218 family)
VGAILELISGLWKWVLAGLLTLFLISRIGQFLGPVDPLQKADVIVAISGGDTASRAATATQLYKDGWGPKLVFSGAALDPLSPSNAAVMREIAIRSGVPSEDVIAEERAVDTAENALNSVVILKQLKAKRVILVTSGYHQRRAAMEFREVIGKNVQIINHPAPDRSWSSLWWTNLRGWWLAVGELIKILVIMIRNAL